MFIRRFSKTIKAVDACGKPRRGFPSPLVGRVRPQAAAARDGYNSRRFPGGFSTKICYFGEFSRPKHQDSKPATLTQTPRFQPKSLTQTPRHSSSTDQVVTYRQVGTSLLLVDFP